MRHNKNQLERRKRGNNTLRDFRDAFDIFENRLNTPFLREESQINK